MLNLAWDLEKKVNAELRSSYGELETCRRNARIAGTAGVFSTTTGGFALGNIAVAAAKGVPIPLFFTALAAASFAAMLLFDRLAERFKRRKKEIEERREKLFSANNSLNSLYLEYW